jgi:ubiquinone/menaquinone biosynthesis C-methylase UbiE
LPSQFGTSEDVQRFERWASTYDKSWLQHYLDRLHPIVLNLAWSGSSNNQPGTVLDIGCGTGRLLQAAQTRWPQAQLIGIDPSGAMAEQTRRRLPMAGVHVAGAETLPLPPESVDLAVSTVSFHHWADRSVGLREVARVLRPGGRFALADVSPPNWLAWLSRSFWSPTAVARAFAGAGLQRLSQQRTLGGVILVTVGVK